MVILGLGVVILGLGVVILSLGVTILGLGVAILGLGRTSEPHNRSTQMLPLFYFYYKVFFFITHTTPSSKLTGREFNLIMNRFISLKSLALHHHSPPLLFCLRPAINVYCTPPPLVPPTTGIDFSRDGSYMALAERRDCKDYVSVFVCEDWHLLRVSGGGGGAECGRKPKAPGPGGEG